MKIQVMSDIHFEFHRDHGVSFFESLPKTEADVLVLAGDIVELKDLALVNSVFSTFCDLYPRVLYVPGNHEYYGSSAPEMYQRVRELDRFGPKNFDVLTGNEPIEIKGQRFLGDTLWFSPASSDRWHHAMRDFQVIRDFEPWVYKQNRKAIDLLDQFMFSGDVVVTHHLPSRRSVTQKYKESPLNDFFVCNLEPLIEERKPRLWIHGHSHSSSRYLLHKTEVVCNPFGYQGENPDYIEALVIEI